MKKIVITLGKNGSKKVETFGFSGPSCKEQTGFLNNIFGAPVESELKPEFYEENETESNVMLDVHGLPEGGRFCG